MLSEVCCVRVLNITFACELSIVLPGTFVAAHDAFDILIFITGHAVLRVLRRSLSVDERNVGGGVQRSGDVQLAGLQGVECVGLQWIKHIR